jgi:DNA-binding XRE family transcriptional regulator
MKQRCYNKNSEQYPHYGGRGIKVCHRWFNYINFLADMGRRPSSRHTLGRINNNDDYEPKNCRWETRSQQSRNRRVNKLTLVKARKIRQLYETGKYSQYELAKQFEVKRPAIQKIIKYKIWKEAERK